MFRPVDMLSQGVLVVLVSRYDDAVVLSGATVADIEQSEAFRVLAHMVIWVGLRVAEKVEASVIIIMVGKAMCILMRMLLFQPAR